MTREALIYLSIVVLLALSCSQKDTVAEEDAVRYTDAETDTDSGLENDAGPPEDDLVDASRKEDSRGSTTVVLVACVEHSDCGVNH